jgi:hypothetical protein
MKLTKVISMVTLLLCAETAFAEGGHNHSHKADSKKEKAARKAISKEDKAQVLAVLEANEALHASFFKYKAAEVDKNAKAVLAAISKISNKEIAKLLKFSTVKLSQITADAKRADNNQNYHSVSMALIHVVNTYDIGGKYNAYSCPMVKKKWVQNSDKQAKVHNPYAPYMPHCGGKDSNY